MPKENWVTPGNAIWIVIGLTASIFALQFEAMLGGLFLICWTMALVFKSVDEWYDVNDPIEAYAPGGANYKPTPWNTERVADPAQPKPWWCE